MSKPWSRAILLPYPGDPFLLNYWLGLFDSFWGDEIDKLYIHLNSSIEDDIVEYIKGLCDNPKIHLKYTNRQIEHGDAINELLDIVEEDYIGLIEDDCYIFKSGAIDKCFRFVESGVYDLVGSKRGSCSQQILDLSAKRHNLDYSGFGDTGCNFWPNLFFSHKKWLINTDRDFKARMWKKGENVHKLGIADEDIVGDTFVNTSIQLMEAVPQERIKYIPQYHGSPMDLDDYQRQRNLWDGLAPWVHVGSLSTGVGGALTDDYNRALSRRKIDKPKAEKRLPINTQAEIKEWERRVQWWLTFWEYADPVPMNIREFHLLYRQAINKIIGQYGLSRSNIRRRQKIYEVLGL